MSATFSLRSVPRSQVRWLVLLLVVAFVLRALFTLYGASAYYGLPRPYCYSFGDALSYMWTAENYIDTGHYTFDFLEPDAAFGRLPGYPLFYGLHYLVFGPVKAIYATAWTQVVLDTLAVLLVFGTLRRLVPGARATAWVGAVLYATYPFIIFWVPMTYTELLATDLTLLILYCAAGYDGRMQSALGLGVLVAAALFTREYLGVLLPILGLWLLRYHGGLRQAAAWRATVLLGVGFGMLYAAWPIRNYLSFHRLELLKPKTAGYASHKEDIDEYRSWVHSWTNDENPWIAAVADGTGPVQFPAAVFADAAEQARAQQLVALARSCGSSFFMQREAVASEHYGFPKDSLHFTQGRELLRTNPAALRSIYTVYRDTAFMLRDSLYLHYRAHNCNAAVGDGFRALRTSYARRKPLAYWLYVPGLNLRKAFFKTGLVGGEQQAGSRGKALVLGGLFGYRTLLLLLGWVGVWRYRRLPVVQVVAMFTAFLYFFVCFLMRNLEMRYLLQADVVLLLPAALLLGGWLDRYLAARQATTGRPVAA